MAIPKLDVQDLELATSVSMASDFNSFEHDVRFFDMGSLQAVWVGANATTAQIIPQASLDKVNWCNLASGTNIKTVNAASGCCIYTFPSIEYKYFRVKFVANSNSAGTISFYTFMKRRRHVD